jgi:hypothetical protein
VFKHDRDLLNRDMVAALPPDERGWFAYAVIGEGPTRYSGNVRDTVPYRDATPSECEKHGVVINATAATGGPDAR